MTLADVRKMGEFALATRKEADKIKDPYWAIMALAGHYSEVLEAIATGQCKDAPPEDMASLILEMTKSIFE
jgi:hypothetical protein